MEPTQSKSVPDPTSRIVDAGDNTAEPTQLSAPSLGEIRGGRSALDYLDDESQVEEGPSESDAEYQGDAVFHVVERRPSNTLLVVSGVLLFGLGLQAGILFEAVYRALT